MFCNQAAEVIIRPGIDGTICYQACGGYCIIYGLINIHQPSDDNNHAPGLLES